MWFFYSPSQDAFVIHASIGLSDEGEMAIWSIVYAPPRNAIHMRIRGVIAFTIWLIVIKLLMGNVFFAAERFIVSGFTRASNTIERPVISASVPFSYPQVILHK